MKITTLIFFLFEPFGIGTGADIKVEGFSMICVMLAGWILLRELGGVSEKFLKRQRSTSNFKPVPKEGGFLS